MKLFEALKAAENLLKNKGVDEFSSDARFLLLDCYNLKSSDYIINKNKEIDEKPYFEMVEKRISGIPVQYITGKTEFMSLEFNVNENVLIPRQDTELIVEEIINAYKNKKPKILDICTGSGCIAISLNKYLNTNVLAFDISEKALLVAKENNTLNETNVVFFKDDALNPENDCMDFDVVVSNPPYIESDVVKGLDEKVKDFEPKIALDGGFDGLEFYRKITPYAYKILKEGGKLFFEIGYNQGETVSEILIENGFKNVYVKKDYCNNSRMAYGEK